MGLGLHKQNCDECGQDFTDCKRYSLCPSCREASCVEYLPTPAEIEAKKVEFRKGWRGKKTFSKGGATRQSKLRCYTHYKSNGRTIVQQREL